jgi:hypothetical protein
MSPIEVFNSTELEECEVMRKQMDHTKHADMALLASAVRAVAPEVFEQTAPGLAAKGLIKPYRAAAWAVTFLVRRRGMSAEAAWRHLSLKLPGRLFAGSRDKLACDVEIGQCQTDPKAAGGFDAKDVAAICETLGIAGRRAAQRLAETNTQ